MGFLDQLWDETLAGPAPDSGLGKLRKYNSLSAATRPPSNICDDFPVTRSITIIRPTSSFRGISIDPGSPPASPAGCSTPGTPMSPATPNDEFKRLTRRRSLAEAFERAGTRSPTVYDWIVISGLDR